mgnify:CR=1 FL=1
MTWHTMHRLSPVKDSCSFLPLSCLFKDIQTVLTVQYWMPLDWLLAIGVLCFVGIVCGSGGGVAAVMPYWFYCVVVDIVLVAFSLHTIR